MSRAASALSRATHLPAWLRRSLAGLTWQGMALVVLLCLVNGARRTLSGWFGMWGTDPPLITDTVDGLVVLAETVAAGLIIAVPVALAVVATYNLAPPRAGLRYPALALAVILSSGAGFALMTFVQGDWPLMPFDLKVWYRYGLTCALFTAAYVSLRVADESAASEREAERLRAQLLKRTQEARLNVLQAQIEPHFLFNTLATVRRLYQTEPETAEAMLDSLMRYLEMALPQMRADGSTLGREAQLAASYLDIQRIRMGRRLAYAFDVPRDLRETPLPPMMLLTLVENAIKHGLAPLPEGGTVRISASVNENELELRVADTGQGFTQASGGGTGLSNVRARLAALYGAAARLSLSHNTPRGVTATIAVPLAVAPQSVDSP